MKLSDIDFKNGKVRIISDLDFRMSVADQIDMLSQDIAQVTYFNRYTIDIGWYPIDMKITDNSFFKIYVIKDSNWEVPLKEIIIYNLDDLKKHLILEIENVPKT